VVADFLARDAKPQRDGSREGIRLKALDPERAAEFLIPYLGKEHPADMRFRAMEALGWSALQQAIPALSAIAKDEKEDLLIRAKALNPGLRYMKHAEAEATAAFLSTPDSAIRGHAYWVLSNHGTDRAVEALESAFKEEAGYGLVNLIHALSSSKHPRAGRIVFEHVEFSAVQNDKDLVSAWAGAMEKYRVPEAQPHMLSLTQKPGNSSPSYFAVRYFGSFPTEVVVPALVDAIEDKFRFDDLYDCVTAFIKSPEITAASKEKLSAYIASGKVKKRERYW
jgi:HEAT repeat protein